MTDTKISDESAITKTRGAVIPVVQAGANGKVTAELLSGMISVALADFVGSNVNTAQPVFDTGQDAVSLEADTTYRFRARYWITRAAGTTSHTTAVLFGGTATFDAIDYTARISNPTGNALAAVNQIKAAVATAVTLTSANTSATENLMIELDGVIRTNGAGTLIPQFQYSAAPGGAPTIKANSFFEIWPVGTDQVTTLGQWS